MAAKKATKKKTTKRIKDPKYEARSREGAGEGRAKSVTAVARKRARGARYDQKVTISAAQAKKEMSDLIIASRIKNHFYEYVQCIDDNRLEEWPEFFVQDCTYRVIPRENTEGYETAFAIIYCENKDQLNDRVLIIRNALVYSMRYDRHAVSNVLVKPGKNGTYSATANYVVCVTDMVDGTSKLFNAGKYEGEVVFVKGRPKFKQLDVIMDTYSVDKHVAVPL